MQTEFSWGTCCRNGRLQDREGHDRIILMNNRDVVVS
jgi:hypothetical protein